MPACLARLRESFGAEFLPTSAHTRKGLDELQRRIEERIVPETATMARHEDLLSDGRDTIALTARHKQAVCQAIDNISQGTTEIEQSNEEVAATMMRAAYEALSDIEAQPIDEQLLDRIFERFCIGK